MAKKLGFAHKKACDRGVNDSEREVCACVCEREREIEREGVERERDRKE